MKKIFSRLITLFLIFGHCCLLGVTGFAEMDKKVDKIDKFPSQIIGESVIDIETLLESKITEDRITEYYNSYSSRFSEVYPEEYSIDKSVYLIEYNVSTEYWDEVKTLDYKGLTEAIYTDYPTIYVPLFGDIPDTNGDMHDRELGYIRLHYHAGLEEYRCVDSGYNLTSEDYRNKTVAGLYEKIAYYLTNNKINAEQVFLIRHPNSLTFGQETVAVIKTKDDTIILDTSDSLHLGSDIKNSDEKIAYSISEYRTLRKEVEKDLYKTVDSWEEVRFGGNAKSQERNGENVWKKIITYTIATIAVLATVVSGTVIWFSYKKRRKVTPE